ncbi:protein NDUFAF4 homolog [Dendroctonus ponderosae]|uniref:Protein NDUFAF4 homolog n=1 Tax=Dendroctonus ponderosae TaxID=77166 RepID=U4UI58_DENPD|nr:protein NDUFAF4 homolog [Dendroctonus ponderosae]ERL92033.1 hypothetical protein D910_09355 [Dendroctonus ponderosae]KAH1012398.1 hypothetical protein HUJ05_011565 [Dendroctonus ponderosae]
MGLMISKLKHPFRDFNLESRAHKFISLPDKKPAPRHVKDELDLQRMKKDYPEVFEESLKKNEVLDRHLKDVYVQSTDIPIEPPKRIDPTRPLPQDRQQPEEFLFGHKEPDRIPVGKTTLRQVLKFVSYHQGDPKVHNVKQIAEEHKLSEDLVRNILKYYRVFEVYMPIEKGKTNAKFAGPSNPKVRIIKEERKLIGSFKGKSDKDET